MPGRVYNVKILSAFLNNPTLPNVPLIGPGALSLRYGLLLANTIIVAGGSGGFITSTKTQDYAFWNDFNNYAFMPGPYVGAPVIFTSTGAITGGRPDTTLTISIDYSYITVN